MDYSKVKSNRDEIISVKLEKEKQRAQADLERVYANDWEIVKFKGRRLPVRLRCNRCGDENKIVTRFVNALNGGLSCSICDKK